MADHVARDLRWPLTAEAIPFLAFTALILASVFGALFVFRRGIIGRRFRAIFGAVAVGWLGQSRRSTPTNRRLQVGSRARACSR